MEHYKDGSFHKVILTQKIFTSISSNSGFFGSPNSTTWVRGQPAEVAWSSQAHHRGGYAYRLCQVKRGKVWKTTEKCFQKGHLNFHGKLGCLG